MALRLQLEVCVTHIVSRVESIRGDRLQTLAFMIPSDSLERWNEEVDPWIRDEVVRDLLH